LLLWAYQRRIITLIYSHRVATHSDRQGRRFGTFLKTKE
jgi:hypothetical protein